MSETSLRSAIQDLVECSKSFSVFDWGTARQQDDEARDYAAKALRLPQSIQHLATKEEHSGKREAFDSEFFQSYNEARYQQQVVRAATTPFTSNYNNRGRGSFNNFRGSFQQGRGFSNGRNPFQYGGRGRGPNKNYSNNYNYLNNHQRPSTSDDKQ
ncbi:hypothetical protein BDB01DRAFT_363560 [Pilobolus umbonatus]|nr:hypothetical protein BDB01DRAFT_363560 [Pilobolus umbonatus]